MPGKVKVRILAGRGLPVMDKSSDTSDAFVEVKLGNTTYKTEVYRRSLNPYWNSEWFRFEVDDEELQDEPLQIRVMDYDTYSANDAIGKLYIDLNPILQKDSKHVLSGWFPIYDTMHGLRGELNCIVKVALFSDANRYRQSSCGFKFFYCPKIPEGYICEGILGFVEELVVNHDPEYQWIDKIRTPRASNEARQILFSKISGEVQRKIGIKSMDLGGNAVIGYQLHFDLEGESGIVVRGLGTAVSLSRNANYPETITRLMSESPEGKDAICKSVSPTPCISSNNNRSDSPFEFPISMNNSNRRLSDSDIKVSYGKSQSVHIPTLRSPPLNTLLKISPEKLQLLEYPFLTITQFPSGLIGNVGGCVSARSVKLLDQINNPDDPETRDAWWTELRKEIRSHKKRMGCNVVLGYTETAYINDEICILSASGTAAQLRIDTDSVANKNMNQVPQPSLPQTCQICHIPYNESSMAFSCSMRKCSICHKAKVPDFLFMTIEPLDPSLVRGYGTLIQARVCRSKRETKGEACAKEISDSLPFLEYELHRQLLTKLKIKGMNCLSNISIQISFGDNMLVAVATGTGSYLAPLPPPCPPKISSGEGILCAKLNEIQVLISDSIIRNRRIYRLPHITSSNATEEEQTEEIMNKIINGDKNDEKSDLVLLEVDDTEDADIISLMIDSEYPQGFDLCNSELLPGKENDFMCNLQMFSQVFRVKLQSNKQFGHQFDWIIQSLFVKFRSFVPCCLTDLKFKIDIPEADLVQIIMTGTTVGLKNSPPKPMMRIRSPTTASDGLDTELIFEIENIDLEDSNENLFHNRLCAHTYPKEHCGIELTPLSYIPGGYISSYLGNLDFFFIRESTNIREYGSLSGFMHNFLTEVFAVVRSHVFSLGGNALTSFVVTQHLLFFNPHKNQAQCLLNVAGDVVRIAYHRAKENQQQQQQQAQQQ